MSLYRNKYRIESARKKDWDYRNPGACFITICVKGRRCLFGACGEGIMHLNTAGNIADQYWKEIPEHFTHVRLGAHVVMPNHVHGILILDQMDDVVGDDVIGDDVVVETLHCNVSTTTSNKFMSGISPKPGSVSTIVRSYKSACTKWINQHVPEIKFQWQERFHDHIIRTGDDFRRIENYINNNPCNWNSDNFFNATPER